MDEPGGYEDAMYEEEMQMMREMREMEEAQMMAAQQFEEYENEAASSSSSGNRQVEPTPSNAAVDSPASAAVVAINPPSSSQPSSSQPQSMGANSFFQNSPALSQISGIADDTVSSIAPNAAQRRLFSTPFVSKTGAGAAAAAGRIASTPFVRSAIAEHGDDEQDANGEIGAGATRKRRLEDLFGDIADIVDDEDTDHSNRDRLYNAFAKRARTEEQIDLEMIEQILERRKRRLAAAANTVTGALHVDRLEALHRFKQQNLSYALPRWPYTTLRRGAGVDRERVYVRMHSEEFERQQIDEVGLRAGQGGGLLGAAREETWSKAQQIINDRLTASTNAAAVAAVPQTPSIADVVASTQEASSALWVEKYRPKKYVDLLSDETTNRSLLSWLKMWDKVVFKRDFHLETAAKRATSNANGISSTSSAFSASKFNRFGASADSANSFNKKTGKFEPFGRFRGGAAAPRRGAGQELRTERDEFGRPQQKVVLLCGPPGLGKTTLAHTIARHAGYTVRELNASDDRSPEAFRQALENGTQMQALTLTGTSGHRSAEAARRPNCIVLDEIDGAPAPAIEYLCRFLTSGGSNNATGDAAAAAAADKPTPITPAVPKPTKRARAGILRRPVICICNDMYAPALRPLRQLAFIVNFSAINGGRLAERLAQIARRERMRVDLTALLALAEKTGNDVRACLAVLQFHHGIGRPLTLLDVLGSGIGQKDRARGLFAVWTSVFQIRRPCKTLVEDEEATMVAAASGGAGVPDGRMMVTMTDMSTKTRAQNVLDAVQMGGDYERLMYGVHENYLAQKMPDPNMRGVVDACDWFCFSDRLRRHINHAQNYSVYVYQQFPFVAWHFLFGSLVWPKIGYPMRGPEFARKATTQQQIETALRRGFTASSTCGIGSGAAVLLDTVPLLRHVLCPQLRSVSLQLLSPKERADLRHTVDVMVDLGLIYVQTKSADGTYQYQMEPNINMLGAFEVLGSSMQTQHVSYTGRQIIAREVELEKMRRVVPKERPEATAAAKKTGGSGTRNAATTTKEIAAKPVPNHLRTLPKALAVPRSRLKETITKDFFGRLSTKQTAVTVQEGGTDVIVKSPIWYRYKEGCNNAVRKDVTIASLL